MDINSVSGLSIKGPYDGPNTEMGISSVYVGDTSCSWEKFIEGEFHLIFIRPESLYSRGSTWRSKIKSDLYQQRICAFVIDEAHLIKKWYIYCCMIH